MDNYMYYVTKKGDTFDGIAFDFYSEEKLASRIIEANSLYADVLVFDAGVTLLIPVISENEQTPGSAPPWSR